MRRIRAGDRRAIDVDVEHAHENRHARIFAVGKPILPRGFRGGGATRAIIVIRPSAGAIVDFVVVKRRAKGVAEEGGDPDRQPDEDPVQHMGMEQEGEEGNCRRADDIFAPLRIDKRKTPLYRGRRKRAVMLVELGHRAPLKGAWQRHNGGVDFHERVRRPHQSRADRRHESAASPISPASSSTPISTRRARTMSASTSWSKARTAEDRLHPDRRAWSRGGSCLRARRRRRSRPASASA